MTALTCAMGLANPTSLELLTSMISVSKLDVSKRNILDVADIDLCLPLHYAARRAFFSEDNALAVCLLQL